MTCRHLASRLGVSLPCFLLLATLSACSGVDRSIDLSRQSVLPVTVGEGFPVSADDLAAAMLRAGFNREQILRDGPAIRNALGTSGGAQVRTGRIVEAMFAVHGQRLYVTSRSRGTFVQPLQAPPVRGSAIPAG